jgi:hypothetical protein
MPQAVFATFGNAEDPDSQRDHPAHRPHGNDRYPPLQARSGSCLLMLPQALALCPSGTLRDRHMRCRMTASLHATATRAFAMPRRWATRIPQASSVDHFWQRLSSVCAAS